MQSGQKPSDGLSPPPPRPVKCGACGRVVPARAYLCPHCGEPAAPDIVEDTGKRWKIGALVGLLMMFVGCLTWAGGTEKAFERAPFLLGFGFMIYVACKCGAWVRRG